MNIYEETAALSSVGSTDLLCRLLASFFARGYPPDELSREWVGDDKPVIRLHWNTGCQREYGYTKARYDEAMEFFNRSWRKLLRARVEIR